MKNIFKYIIVFIILIISFNVLLFLSALFPSSIIEKNVKESAYILSKEGNIYDLGGIFYTVNNNFTDALMVNEAYSIDNTKPIYSYMSVRKNYKKGQTRQELKDSTEELITINNGEIRKDSFYDTVGELQEFVDGKTETSICYARYWHGYLPVLRGALIFFNITQIRYILLGIFTILLIYVVALIRKKINIGTAIIFAYSLIVEGYFYVSYSLESSPVFIVMMIACIILLKRVEKIKNFYMYMFIVGSITNFVDYLTVPLITLLMPLYLYILFLKKRYVNKTFKYYLKITLKSCVIWGMGYALTWFTKWLIYDLIYNQGLIKSAISQVIYRSNGSREVIAYRIPKIFEMFIVENMVYITLGVIPIINSIVFKYVSVKRQAEKSIIKIKENIKMTVVIIIIAVIPFLWYILLANHTSLHSRFTYRNMVVFVFGILTFIKETFNIGKIRQKPRNTLKKRKNNDKI